MRALDTSQQVVIAYRETDQRLVTTAADYLNHCQTKYRNWHLSGRGTFVELPLVMSLYLPVGEVSS